MARKIHDVTPYESKPERRGPEPTMLATNGGRYRFHVGHVRAGEEGRKVDHGPMVPGPWAYAFGLGTCIAANPEHGTYGEIKRAKAQGYWLEVEDGMLVRVAGNVYRIDYHAEPWHQQPPTGEWLRLTLVEDIEPITED